MPNDPQAAAIEVDIPRRSDLLLPAVGKTRDVGFPIRITDHDGTTKLKQKRSMRFGFVAAGTSFETQGEATGNGVALSIRARVGLLPFSAESTPERQQVVALLSSPPPHARAGVTGGNQVVLDGALTLPEALTPVSLIAALTEWVVNVQPWLGQISLRLADVGAHQRVGA